jgi:hypothetical protein
MCERSCTSVTLSVSRTSPLSGARGPSSEHQFANQHICAALFVMPICLHPPAPLHGMGTLKGARLRMPHPPTPTARSYHHTHLLDQMKSTDGTRPCGAPNSSDVALAPSTSTRRSTRKQTSFGAPPMPNSRGYANHKLHSTVAVVRLRITTLDCVCPRHPPTPLGCVVSPIHPTTVCEYAVFEVAHLAEARSCQPK